MLPERTGVTPGEAEEKDERFSKWRSERVVLLLLGVSVLGYLGADVYLTVFHATGRGGPATRIVSRLVWAAFRRLGVRDDGVRRAELLALSGPTVVVLTLFVWMVSLVVGYALIYLPYMGSYLVSPGSLRTHWVEALYYSGYTASTVGLGDLIADHEALRLLTVMEAMSGFALVTVGVTYLLSVYGELTARQTLASGIAAYFPEGVGRTLERVESAGPDALVRWMEGITPTLLAAYQAHYQFPVLHYFHPADPGDALPVQLGRLLQLWRSLRDVGPQSGLSGIREHPSFVALRSAVTRYLLEVDRDFVAGSGPAGKAEDDLDRVERAHARLLQHMAYSECIATGSKESTPVEFPRSTRSPA